MKYRIIKSGRYSRRNYPYRVQRQILGIWLPALGYNFDTMEDAEGHLLHYIQKIGVYAPKKNTKNVVYKEICTEDLVIDKLKGTK
jgi:hypothetical protein